MIRIPSRTRGAVTLLAIAAAIAGWVVVFLQDKRLDSLENELSDARRQEALASSEASAVSEGSTTAGDVEPAASSVSNQTLAILEQLKSELAASEAERALLNQRIYESETELKQLRTELDQKTEPPSDAARSFRTLTRTRMRAGPTTDAEEIAVIAKGASAEVIDTVANGTWHEVRVLGYSFNELLEPLPNE